MYEINYKEKISNWAKLFEFVCIHCKLLWRRKYQQFACKSEEQTLSSDSYFVYKVCAEATSMFIDQRSWLEDWMEDLCAKEGWGSNKCNDDLNESLSWLSEKCRFYPERKQVQTAKVKKSTDKLSEKDEKDAKSILARAAKPRAHTAWSRGLRFDSHGEYVLPFCVF